MQYSTLTTSILSEKQAAEICTWRYDGEYSVYNFSDWSEVVKNGWGLSIKEIRENEYIAVCIDEVMMAYGRIFICDSKVFVGVGVKPTACGNGLGSSVMKKLIETAELRYPDQEIFVEVRRFNKRAKKCYESIGFHTVDEYWKDTLFGADNFYLMEYRA